MSNIDLKKIIAEHELNEPLLAVSLFPDNKHPTPALARVIKGEALLNSEQLAKLAEIVGVKVDELYTEEI